SSSNSLHPGKRLGSIQTRKRPLGTSHCQVWRNEASRMNSTSALKKVWCVPIAALLLALAKFEGTRSSSSWIERGGRLLLTVGLSRMNRIRKQPDLLNKPQPNRRG